MDFQCGHLPGTFDETFSATEETKARVRWVDGQRSLAEPGATHFIVAARGGLAMCTDQTTWRLSSAMFAMVPDPVELSGSGLVVTCPEWSGMFLAGGPVEASGRLRYIDGCSSTVLIAPPRLGDPSINFLRVPPGTDQTEHTHPSLRVGLIVSGRGGCRVPGGDFALEPGAVFCLPSDQLHSFHTDDDELRIIVFHPDTDFGPTDEEHPMLRRTIVDGVPAHLRDDVPR